MLPRVLACLHAAACFPCWAPGACRDCCVHCLDEVLSEPPPSSVRLDERLGEHDERAGEAAGEARPTDHQHQQADDKPPTQVSAPADAPPIRIAPIAAVLPGAGVSSLH